MNADARRGSSLSAFIRVHLRLLLSLVLTSPASAQTAPSLLIEPWPDSPILAQTFDEVSFIHRGEVEQDDSDLAVFSWDSFGRVRLDRHAAQPDLVVGYRYLNVAVDADRGDLDGSYNDLAIAGGLRLGEWRGWDVSLIAGGGSANDDHWRLGDAPHGIGTLHLSRRLAAGEQLHLGVSYDGNRAILPDVPLPYVSYVHAADPKLLYILGLPVSGLTWKPDDRWSVSLRYTAPTNVTADVRCRLTRTWSLFGVYENKLDAFHEHDAAHDGHRLFYERDLAMLGVRYEHPMADVRLGAGYVFEQQFSRGWDTRQADTVADVDNRPMLMLTVHGSF